jgi:hypothetical protein
MKTYRNKGHYKNIIDDLYVLACISVYVRFEVFTAVTMKNSVFWDIRTQFIPHIKHITSFQVFTAVTMKNAIFWDVTPCGSCKNIRFGVSSN